MLYLAYLAQHVLMLSFFTSIQTRIEKGKIIMNILTKKWGEIKNE